MQHFTIHYFLKYRHKCIDIDRDAVTHIIAVLSKDPKTKGNIRPGRRLLRFLELKSLTLEKTLSRLGFSHGPLVLFGLLTQRQAFDFSRSLASLFCRIRELAIAAAMASLTVRHPKLSEDTIRFHTSTTRFLLGNLHWTAHNQVFIHQSPPSFVNANDRSAERSCKLIKI